MEEVKSNIRTARRGMAILSSFMALTEFAILLRDTSGETDCTRKYNGEVRQILIYDLLFVCARLAMIYKAPKLYPQYLETLPVFPIFLFYIFVVGAGVPETEDCMSFKRVTISFLLMCHGFAGTMMSIFYILVYPKIHVDLY